MFRKAESQKPKAHWFLDEKVYAEHFFEKLKAFKSFVFKVKNQKPKAVAIQHNFLSLILRQNFCTFWFIIFQQWFFSVSIWKFGISKFWTPINSVLVKILGLKKFFTNPTKKFHQFLSSELLKLNKSIFLFCLLLQDGATWVHSDRWNL